jgi:hypothetical protein
MGAIHQYIGGEYCTLLGVFDPTTVTKARFTRVIDNHKVITVWTTEKRITKIWCPTLHHSFNVSKDNRSYVQFRVV